MPVRWIAAALGAVLASVVIVILLSHKPGPGPAPAPSPARAPTPGVPAPPPAAEPTPPKGPIPAVAEPLAPAEVARLAGLGKPGGELGPPLAVPDRIPEVRALVRALTDPHGIDAVEQRLGTATPQALRAALDAPTVAHLEERYPILTPKARCLVAWALAKSEDPGVSVFLGAQLATDADLDVRRSLVEALQGRVDPESERALVKALGADAEAGLRGAAARALSSHAASSTSALTSLIDGLASAPSPVVRVACAESIARVPSEASAKALMAACGGTDPLVRIAAAAGLGWQRGFVPDAWMENAVAGEADPSMKATLEEARRHIRGELNASDLRGCGAPVRRK